VRYGLQQLVGTTKQGVVNLSAIATGIGWIGGDQLALTVPAHDFST
jgi:hypothetical protein